MKQIATWIVYLVLLLPLPLAAQTQVLMSDGTASTCNGTLFDSGGQGATGYQNNEYYILTICPDTPGDVITLDFLNFALDQTNTATPPGNNQDNLCIFDGNTTGAPSLGCYTGNQLQGLLVTGTTFNTSGCLTLVFTSNNQGTGVFAATITCSTPCQRPTVVMNAPQVANNPVRICDGDLVNFDGSASYPAAGFNIVDYIWDWGDGTIDTLTTGITSHTFSQGAGEYMVNLYVIDDNDCISTNLETIQVWVATTPSFNGTSPDSLLCLGEQTCMDGVVTPTTWTAQPVSSLGGATYLPDDVGQCFTATLDFQSFLPGQTLNNVNDLLSICVNMEHSYMGDLVASIYCPNGTGVIMHQQGGSYTNIGDPNQLDDSTLVGVCEQYCWSPTATNGTWVDNSVVGGTPNTYTNSSGVESLVPGTYESLNSLAALVGCPLNGTWTIEFCDLWGADDGFVCDWSIDFHPSLFPPLTQFTPSIGNQCDSSYWSASGPAASIITSTSGDCNQVCMMPTATGTYDYTYTVEDNHGCTFDTTIIVTVQNGPTVNAGNDTIVCSGSQFQLNAVPNGGILPAPGCPYTINMFDTFGDGWNGFQVEVIINGQSAGFFTFNTGSSSTGTFTVQDGDDIEINTISGSWDSEVSYQILDCQGNVVWQDGVNYTGANPLIGNNIWNGTAVNPTPPNYNYLWTPATGLSDPNIGDPTVTVTGNIQYVVEIWETNHMLCSSFDTINITLDPSVYAGEDSVITVCYNDPAFDMFQLLGGGPAATGSWFDPGFVGTSNMLDPSVSQSGLYTYIVPGGVCPPDSATVDVTILPQNNPACGCPLNGTTTVVDVDCFGACNGQVTINDQYAVDYSFDGLTWGPNNTSTNLCAGAYTVYSSDTSYGPTCIDTLTFTIVEPTALTLSVTNTNVSCFNACDGTIDAVVGGGTAGYTYAWTGLPGSVANQTNVCAGQYNLTVTDGNGCVIDTLNISVTEPPQLTIDNVLAVDETCFESCDGSITVTAGNAILFSIDGGATFVNSGSFTGLCAGNYNIVVVDTAGCTENSSADLIGPAPVWAGFSASPQPTTVSNTEIQFTNNSGNASTYQWDFSGLGTSSEEHPMFPFPEVAGQYLVCLTAFDANNCSDSACNTIVINEELIVYVPNSFSPDGDGINDFFVPIVSGHIPEQYEFFVFDRWGQRVFESETAGEGWAGTVNGHEAKTDVYVWKLRVWAEHDESRHEYVGHVTVLR